MITKIEVDGFKSLSEFELRLKTGLNILVGPNGAGKTNIIQFFEFLSKIAFHPIAHAVTSVGGAGSIFQKKGDKKYQDNIKFKIFGSSNFDAKTYIYYEFSVIIKSSFEKDEIYYDEQELKIKLTSNFLPEPIDKKAKMDWDFHMHYQYSREEKPSVVIHTLNNKKIKVRYILDSKDKSDNEKVFREMILSNDPSSRIIVSPLHPFVEFASTIINDIQGGETFNIVPSKVKEQEDAATPPGIKKDGSGLSTTLYALKKTKPVSPTSPRMRIYFGREGREYDPQSLSKIINYLKKANKTIKALDIENDPFDNRLIIKLTIETGTYKAVLPLSSMSDGTIKWLTLITAILTSKTIFSIEEPENFLHPWMQAEIINIMREHIAQKKNNSFVLMTTHSESLLNHSNPEEIILIDLIEGKTVAKRIANIELIKEEISTSGLGIGYFYFTNSLEI